MAWAVALPSPVNITMAMFCARSAASAACVVGFTGSAIAMIPASLSVYGGEDDRGALATEPSSLAL